ncbi:MAG: hypothetical protein WC326_12050 [Candidatus Delongbacteria bacterium]
MARENWPIELEAYLDGELEPAAAEAFRQECAADPELRHLQEQRLALRELARAALGELPAGLSIPLARPRRRRWLALAAAAVLALMVFRLSGPGADETGLIRPAGSRGLVTAPRLGERVGVVRELAPGRLELPDGYFNMGGE